MTRAQSIAACCTLSSCRRGVKTSLTTECRSSTGQILGWSPAHDHLGAGGSTSSRCGGRSLGWSPGTDHHEPTRTTSWAILGPEPRREPPSASFLASTAITSYCPVALPIGRGPSGTRGSTGQGLTCAVQPQGCVSAVATSGFEEGLEQIVAMTAGGAQHVATRTQVVGFRAPRGGTEVRARRGPAWRTPPRRRPGRWSRPGPTAAHPRAVAGR